MNPLRLTPAQTALIQQPLDSKIFLEGNAGCGKTTTAVERLLFLLENGVPGNTILLVTPQRSLAEPYLSALRSPDLRAGGVVTSVTLGGLARRMLELYWPLVAETAGFSHPDEDPTFLTMETAQYYMAHLVEPLLEQGYFETITMDRNRLYSQIIDNLNKAALIGFPYDEIGTRLKSAWSGEKGQIRAFDDAQECAVRFRNYCLDHNLLDFSLQLELFYRYLWTSPYCRDYLLNTYSHLVVDNLEEDAPVTHDLLADWLPHCASALLVFDHEAGYRRFLGADPQTAYALKSLCSQSRLFEEIFTSSADIQSLSESLAVAVDEDAVAHAKRRLRSKAQLDNVLEYTQVRFFPQMLDWVSDKVANLVNESGVQASEIAVLSPYLSDSLRFSMTQRLEKRGVAARVQRPSRSLREESIARCLLTLMKIAHPKWEMLVSEDDLTYALMLSIEEMDMVRARLLASIVKPRRSRPELSSFDLINPLTQERITHTLGRRYEKLRIWLVENGSVPDDELDYFISRLFGEVLSQPGFAFRIGVNAQEITANLIESLQKFRWAASKTLAEEGITMGKNYVEMVQKGIIAASFVRSWQPQEENAVLLAPAYTFLMRNQAVDYQFWLDASSNGWAERPIQPLTHPYILARGWQTGRTWTDVEDVETNRTALYRLMMGLLRRCRVKVFLGFSEFGETGYEGRGALLRAFDHIFRSVR